MTSRFRDPTSQHRLDRARSLRKAMSLPEAMIWSRLRVRDGGPVFRRQHLLGPYVLDFYCAQAKLVIEIDGMTHDNAGQARRDLVRDSWLKAQGLETLRIAAVDVLSDADDVAAGILRLAVARSGWRG